jgi:tetratricopeptide (TPR) repeat protein
MTRPGFTLFILLSMAFLLAKIGPALAQEPAPPPNLPWGKDVAMYLAAQSDLNAGGIKALAPHVADFEAALVNGRQFFPDGVTVDGHRYVMADGPTENLLVTLSAAAKKTDGVTMVTAVPNPYPLIAMELGSYFDEIGKPEDAVRVLDEGLALTPSPEGAVGAHAGEMMGEKGAALDALKRYVEGLAVFEQALASHVLTARDRARLDRGRGFALTELDRLDDAEAAYRDSLQQEPGNARALAELGYIARLRAGGAKAPPKMFASPSQKPQQ